jgi:hypothetical protein
VENCSRTSRATLIYYQYSLILGYIDELFDLLLYEKSKSGVNALKVNQIHEEVKFSHDVVHSLNHFLWLLSPYCPHYLHLLLALRQKRLLLWRQLMILSLMARLHC